MIAIVDYGAGNIFSVKNALDFLGFDSVLTKDKAELEAADSIILPGVGAFPAAMRMLGESGLVDTLKEQARKKPFLGICLGHQAICLSFGATVTYAKQMMHGKQSVIELDSSCPLFYGLVKRIEVARYHSLAADSSTIPEELKVTAVTDDGEVMAVMHKEYPIYGLQFHPESIMTPAGKEIIKNFINISGGKTK